MLTKITLLIALCFTSLVLAAPASPDVSDIDYLTALPSWNDELTAILPDDANLIASIRKFSESLDLQEGGDAGAHKRDVADYDDGSISVRHSDVPDPSILEKFDRLAEDSLNKREFTGAGWTDCSPSSWGEIPVNDYCTLRIIITMMMKHIELPSHFAMTTAKVGNTIAAVVQYDPGSSVFMTWDWNEWTRQIGELCVVNRQGLEGYMRPFGWPLRVGIMRTE